VFDRKTDYPCAVTSHADAGLAEGIRWCINHKVDNEPLTLWVPLKSSLRHNDRIANLSRQPWVETITGRGMSFVRGGPVLATWPRMDDIGEIQRSAARITALCVVAWNDDEIRPWVRAVKPAILGNGSAWEQDLYPEHDLDPVAVEALKTMTMMINHNNTISAGYEKDIVVSTLLALRSHGYRLDSDLAQGWALANGWSGKNPQRLADYIRDINNGKTPSARTILRDDFVERLRREAAREDE
jgi:hypothetical protein